MYRHIKKSHSLNVKFIVKILLVNILIDGSNVNINKEIFIKFLDIVHA